MFLSGCIYFKFWISIVVFCNQRLFNTKWLLCESCCIYCRYIHSYIWATTFYLIIYFYLFYRFIPESPRWLLTHGKNEKVLKYFRKSAKINGLHMPVSVGIAPVEGNVSSLKMWAPSVVMFSGTLPKILCQTFFCI